MSIGAFWDFGDSEMKPENDEKRGRELMEFFVSEFAARYPGYGLDMDKFLLMYNIGPFLFENVGMNQRLMELSTEEAEDILIQIINKGEGRVPSNWMVFGQSMAKAVQDVSFWSSIPYVALESFKEFGEISKLAKEGVVTTLETSKYAMPVLIYGGIGIVIWFVAKGLKGATERAGGSFGRAIEQTGRGTRRALEEIGSAAADRIRKR